MREPIYLNNINTNKWKMIFDWEFFPILDSIINAQVPGLSLGLIEIPGFGGIKIKKSGDSIKFPPLELQFIVDEYMINYEKFHQWIFSNFNPKTAIIQDNPKSGTLHFCHDNGITKRKLVFQRLRPIDLSPIDLAINENDGTEFHISSVTLEYDWWDFVPLTTKELERISRENRKN